MNKKLILTAACLLGLACFSTYAEDELPEASKEIIQDYKQLCMIYASDDNVAKEQMAEYLLTCVNDELSEQGYQKIAQLDDE